MGDLASYECDKKRWLSPYSMNPQVELLENRNFPVKTDKATGSSLDSTAGIEGLGTFQITKL